MSDTSKKKTYLGTLYLITLSALNILSSNILTNLKWLDKNIANAIAPVIAAIISYLLVVYVFSKFPSIDEADTNRIKKLKKVDNEEYIASIQEKLKHIRTALEDLNITEETRNILQKRYSELTLELIAD